MPQLVRVVALLFSYPTLSPSPYRGGEYGGKEFSSPYRDGEYTRKEFPSLMRGGDRGGVDMLGFAAWLVQELLFFFFN